MNYGGDSGGPGRILDFCSRAQLRLARGEKEGLLKSEGIQGTLGDKLYLQETVPISSSLLTALWGLGLQPSVYELSLTNCKQQH